MLLADAVKVQPKWDQPYIKQAELLKESKTDLPQALALLNQACTLNPKSYEALYERGRLFSRLNDREKAKTDFEACLKIDINKNEAFHELIETLIASGQCKQALARIDQRIKGLPNNRDYVLYLQRGNCCLAMGRNEFALSDYNKTLSLNPKCIEAIGNRGIANAHVEEPNKALSDLETAISAGQKDPKLFETLGAVYVDLHQPKRALKPLSEAIALVPTEPKFYRKRSQTYEEIGDVPAALRDLDCAVRLDPGGFEIRVRRALLRNKAGRLQDALADCNFLIAQKRQLAAAYAERETIYRRL
ncbi:MAG: tetratricopeptide repeat protein, partial [Terriglobales bacterium]